MAARRRRTDRHSFIHFLNACNGIVQDVVRLLQTDYRSRDYIDTVSVRLGAASENILRATERYPQCYELLDLVLSLIQTVNELKTSVTENSFKAGTKDDGKPGRPMYDISSDQLRFLLDMGFATSNIAKLLGVSKSTIKRRLRFFGFSISEKYSNISDDDLDVLVRPMLSENPHLGYRSIQSRLTVNGHICQEDRVRDALIRVDPVGTALRWSDTIQRRNYRVAGANSLWHIDGNHKLIRWKLVVHGGIDGYSRLVVYLGCATNNRSATVFGLFLQSTEKYGIPSRVRSDCGTENTDVAIFMVMHRGANRGSIIQGRSVHNQRIERLWLDLYKGCTNIYYDLFSFLEEQGKLDVENNTHMWALHYVFLPRIQKSLKDFQNMWNNHKMSSERGKTPIQLFIQGALQNFNSNSSAISDLFDHEIVDHDQYGIDWAGPLPDAAENANVTVDETNCPLTMEQFAQLQEEVDPLCDIPSDYGITNFLKTLDFIALH